MNEIVISRVDVFRSVFRLRFRFHSPISKKQLPDGVAVLILFESEFHNVPSLQCVMILGAKILTPSTTSISEGFYCSKNWSIFTSSEQTLQNDINFVQVSIIDRRKLRPPKHHVTFCAIQQNSLPFQIAIAAFVQLLFRFGNTYF